MSTDSVDLRSPLERMLHRDNLIVVFGLTTISVLSWIFLVRMSAEMHSMAADVDMHAAMGMPETRAWTFADLFGLFLMWAVMMGGMMLPSAAPVILLVTRVYRRRGDHRARLSSVAFTAGYLLAWTAFSAAAATTQVMLHRAALLSPAMVSRSTVLAGAILVAAGIYQWLPIKTACLTECRSPLGFLSQHWREGITGALSMGLRHGIFCVGCCWALMAVLFVAGVMNLLWVAAIAALVLIEKRFALGPRVGRYAGALLVLWGIYVLVK